MIFCFDNDKWIIYHNGKCAQTLSLQTCKKLTIAFNLAGTMEIEIIECQFEYNMSNILEFLSSFLTEVSLENGR